jgi:hypothetical protein
MAALCFAAPGLTAPTDGVEQGRPLLPDSGVVRKVQRELLVLPGYTVFDYLTCKQLENGSVMLSGQVTDAALKRSAEEAAKAVAADVPIVNNIQVLSRSTSDQELRSRIHREVYGDPYVAGYAIRKVAPIHIIVNKGKVTLEGTVDTASDRFQIESATRFGGGAQLESHLIATQDSGLTVWRNAATLR